MKIKISENIIEKYPEVNISVIVAKNVDNTKYNEEIQQLLRGAEKELREDIEFDKILEVSIISKWREIYKSFGAKPSDYRSSVEAILRRALKKELPKINCLVDIYNYISAKYLMTVGGEDIDTLEGDLVLDFAEGDEEFTALGSDKKESPWKGEVVYRDDKGVVCRCWNWKEGDRTKLTEQTKNAVIVIENPIPEQINKLDEAEDRLKELIKKHCGGDIEAFKMDKENLEVEI
ncbi:MAG: phenylalanine--tRNA ligase beta subunit-related protein [archaeon]